MIAAYALMLKPRLKPEVLHDSFISSVKDNTGVTIT